MDLIFENDDFLITNKPEGFSVHKDQEEKGFLILAREQFNNPELQLVHRLDKITSGLLILAKKTQATKDLSLLFQTHQIQKFYLAISDKKPIKKQGTIKGSLQKSRRGSWKLTRDSHNLSVTQFFSYSLEPGSRLFLVKPITGKTHQIRVALKSIGSPILGDRTYYGAEANNADRTYLHCYALRFKWKQNIIEVMLPPTTGENFSSDSFHKKIEDLKQPWDLQWPKNSI